MAQYLNKLKPNKVSFVLKLTELIYDLHLFKQNSFGVGIEVCVNDLAAQQILRRSQIRW